AILFITGQTFAQVTVYVDVKQTGPSVGGEIQARVGKNVNATYSATARYNGQPTLNREDTIQSTKWTYSVSSDNKVVYNPKSGSSDSVMVAAKSAEAGTYTIAFTFEVTFTIKKPVVDGQGKYQYDSNGNQKFDTYTKSYFGYGSEMLNVKDGRFKVEIKPKELFRGRRNILGIGELAKVVIDKETPNDPAVEFYYMDVEENINDEGSATLIGINGPDFQAGHYKGTAKIKVWAKINGVKEEKYETIGVSVIEPSGIFMEKLLSISNTSTKGVLVGFRWQTYILPNTVSFSNVEFKEGTCPSETDKDKYWSKVFPRGCEHPESGWTRLFRGITPDKHNQLNSLDKVGSGVCSQPPKYCAGSFFEWDIPWFYRVKGAPENKDKKFIVKHRIDMTNDQGHMTVKKGGVQETYPSVVNNKN
ncbi:MAG: hypothetical protein LBC74_00375, partial [Planctomycetaceae bacterium]|nr:hypothetical protein [Planctomycetaceae bacterium]